MSSLTEMQAQNGLISKSKKQLLNRLHTNPDSLPSAEYARARALYAGRKAKTVEAEGLGAKRDYRISSGDRAANTARVKQNRGGTVGGGAPTPVRPAAPGAPGNPKPTRGMKRQQRKALRARKKKGYGQGAVNPNAARGSQYANNVSARVNANVSPAAKKRLANAQTDRYIFSGGPKPSHW